MGRPYSLDLRERVVSCDDSRHERARSGAAVQHRRWITVQLAEKPDLTLRALAAELKTRGAKGSSFAVWSIVADTGLSF